MRVTGLMAGALIMMQVGCDGPGGGGRPAGTAADSAGDIHFPEGDATATPDTTIASDSTIATETSIATDTTATTSQPDTQTSVCAEGCLAATPVPGALVPFTQLPSTIPPPNLSGGSAPTGDWRLAEVDIFPYGTFADGVQVTISNEGQTRGRALFDGDAMALELFLDLRIRVQIEEDTGEDTGQANVKLGGCHSAQQGEIVGSLASCASGFPSGVTPPNAIAYELGNELELAIELAPEFLIAMLPEDQQQFASFVIVGPLTLVATMDRP